MWSPVLVLWPMGRESDKLSQLPTFWCFNTDLVGISCLEHGPLELRNYQEIPQLGQYLPLGRFPGIIFW